MNATFIRYPFDLARDTASAAASTIGNAASTAARTVGGAASAVGKGAVNLVSSGVGLFSKPEMPHQRWVITLKNGSKRRVYASSVNDARKRFLREMQGIKSITLDPVQQR